MNSVLRSQTRFLIPLLIALYSAPTLAQTDLFAAYYYPWYIKGDWSRHGYQGTPLLGKYGTDDPKVVEQHIKWATDAGINALIISWWGPDHLAEKHFRSGYQKARNRDDINFAFIYESLGRLDDADGKHDVTIDFSNENVRQQFYRDLLYLKTNYFKSQSYLTIDRKPVVVIYVSRTFRNLRRSHLHDIEKQLDLDLFFIADDPFFGRQKDPKTALNGVDANGSIFDAYTTYNMFENGLVRDDDTALSYTKREAMPIFTRWSRSTKFCPNIMPTYHDFRGNKTLPGTPDQFRQMIKTVQSLPGEAMSKDVRKLIFVTSFNEWWEGTTVEPAKGYGHSWLDIIREFTERRAQFELVDSSPSGEIVHTVECAYQKGKTKIRVLLPAKMGNTKLRYPVVYVLPVEPLDQSRFGDGLTEIKKLNLHNKHKTVFVAPTFSDLPWYCDHPTDKTKRQEKYFTNVVVPFVERMYPCKSEPKSRHLLGFSKSGWGAWSLLLRHPNTFGKAVAWDAPLMMDKPNKFGMGPVFGSQENFEKYQISKLLEAKAKTLGKSKRLTHIGHGSFRFHHDNTEALLKKLAIPHTYLDGPKLKHDWHSGWVTKAVEALTQ